MIGVPLNDVVPFRVDQRPGTSEVGENLFMVPDRHLTFYLTILKQTATWEDNRQPFMLAQWIETREHVEE
jgi:hypothetical protein